MWPFIDTSTLKNTLIGLRDITRPYKRTPGSPSRWMVGFFFLCLAVAAVACNQVIPAGVTPQARISPTAGVTPPAVPSATAIPATFAPTVTNLPPSPTITLPSLGIGSTQVSPKDGMLMVYVPAGSFQMGSTGDQIKTALALCIKDAGKRDDNCSMKNEAPQRTIYLDAFWIDQTDVTNAMYIKCVTDKACQPPHGKNSSKQTHYYGNPQYLDYPVVEVNWAQAQAYCKWVGGSLPSEAQWEKAARGTDDRTYPWGEGIDSSKVNFDYSISDPSKVGSYPAGASPFGALDMAGNVSQWVADWFGNYDPDSLRNPTGPAKGTFRIIRGGSWWNYDYNVRTSVRFSTSPDKVDNYIGFRCAASAN